MISGCSELPLGSPTPWILHKKPNPSIWFMNRVMTTASVLKMKSSPIAVLILATHVSKLTVPADMTGSLLRSHEVMFGLCRLLKSVSLCTRYVCAPWYFLLYSLASCQSLWMPLELHISKDQLEMSHYQSFPDAAGSGRRVSEQDLFS